MRYSQIYDVFDGHDGDEEPEALPLIPVLHSDDLEDDEPTQPALRTPVPCICHPPYPKGLTCEVCHGTRRREAMLPVAQHRQVL